MELIDAKKIGQGIGLYKIIALFGLPLVFILVIIAIGIVVSVFTLNNNDSNNFEGGTANVSAEVMRYEPIVREYAAKHGIENYVPIILALMQQESGGRGGDPMQSSESLGYAPNTITDPVVSIKQGVIHFKSVIKKANGDVKLALASYNFGGGFIDYVNKRGGKYTLDLAKAFSKLQAEKLGWSCSDWQIKPYCYGDIGYVDKVMKNYSGGEVGSGEKPNLYGLVYPMKNHTVTSPFGVRTHPITGVPKFHKGVDFSCNNTAIPVHSVKPGTVSMAGWQNSSNHNAGYGQRIYVDHGNGQSSVYAHLSKIGVQVGQKVKQGQTLGSCGTTGSSTGMHLHFEIRMNDNPIDPLPYLRGKGA